MSEKKEPIELSEEELAEVTGGVITQNGNIIDSTGQSWEKFKDAPNGTIAEVALDGVVVWISRVKTAWGDGIMVNTGCGNQYIPWEGSSHELRPKNF